jgi:hypothetical protein
MEGGAQRQPEIDKERRQREEAESRVEEVERQKEEAAREHEAEMNRMRERVAELERRAV